jgi:C-terminal processing protease CtpA/Prc
MSPGETANGHHDNYPRYAVGLVFVEDKTLGFPRVFVRDVLPGSAAQHSSRLKRGDLLVLVDNEDVYGYDLDHIATILPGRFVGVAVSCCSLQ